MFTMQNGFGIPLPHLFRMQTHQAVLEGISVFTLIYTLTREFVCLTLQDVITGILYTNCPLLNYLILIAKLYLWGCRRNQTPPVITAFSSKVKIKYETEKYICVKTNKMDKFNKKWALPLDSVP